MRHLGLERLDVLAGIFRTFTAKLHSLCRGASRHGTLCLAVKAALFRPAPVALHFLERTLKTPGHHAEPFRVFFGSDEYAT
jgi:hypothetical protein